MFKTNVKRFVSLRRTMPAIALQELRMLPRLFPTPGHVFGLDPSFEPSLRGRPDATPPPDSTNTVTFGILQRFSRVNLLAPIDAPHMWNAAIESKACRLTPLGEHYRRLAAAKRI